MELEASEEQLEALRMEVEEIKAQMAELEQEKRELLKNTRRLEDRQVKNWKWMHEASKFSGIQMRARFPNCFSCFVSYLTGVSVNKYSEQSCTFHFHPMWLNTYQQTYSLTVDFVQNGKALEKEIT